MSILVLTALDAELDTARAPAGVDVVFTGVGKINTTIATLLAVQLRKPSLVINYGTAGKIKESLRGLVEVAHVIQRDMIAEPLAPRGTTPYAPELDRLSSGHGDVICGTGDSFVTATDPWLVILPGIAMFLAVGGVQFLSQQFTAEARGAFLRKGARR